MVQKILSRGAARAMNHERCDDDDDIFVVVDNGILLDLLSLIDWVVGGTV